MDVVTEPAPARGRSDPLAADGSPMYGHSRLGGLDICSRLSSVLVPGLRSPGAVVVPGCVAGDTDCGPSAAGLSGSTQTRRTRAVSEQQA